MPWSAVTRAANKAAVEDLALSVPPSHITSGKKFSFSIKTLAELSDTERDAMWNMLQENMHELYCSSTFGWSPQKKRKEMFHTSSRFIIARLCPDSEDSAPCPDVVAYSIFRFEREERQNVVYCYELQVAKDARRFGLGRLFVQILAEIGAKWDMTKIMLTVLKANQPALLFYKSTGFSLDESSPDYPDEEEDEKVEMEECDYSILSRCIKSYIRSGAS